MTKFYFVDGGRSACSELLMIVSGPKKRLAMNIFGVFDVKDISRLPILYEP